ncbi:GAF domain-containing protein [Bdellovibrio bacteriovorus]|uniref:GAF domain-containing protein n=1 Tax=Bdellovibrio bacteriovorus TaxID=959 RepID=UPI0035A67958
MISPSSFKNAFLGVIPSTILTASPEGIPNVAYLSQVYLLNETQLGLTTQFFNKTKSNISTNPHCTVRVYDPDNFCAYEIEAKFSHTESDGPLFSQLAKKFDAIADYSGASHFFKLQSIEVLNIVNIEKIGNEAYSSEEASVPLPTRRTAIDLDSLQRVCERVSEAKTLEDLFDSILKAIDWEFGLRHSMILMKQGDSDRLYTISTRGYDQFGVGSEVKIGEGVIGRAAEMKVPFAHASLPREILYARATAPSPHQNNSDSVVQYAIPLPGLKTSCSQMAIPIVLRGELLGVLFAESENIYEFRDSDESILKTLSHVLALAIQNLQLCHDFEIVDAASPDVTSPKARPSKEKLIFSYFQKEDCILLNGEYLIRNVPARILWRMLKEYQMQGKTEFTNRELRMDSWLQLPEVKDNLETRLILLRKRLEKKCPLVSIVSGGRGRIALVVSGDITLSEN